MSPESPPSIVRRFLGTRSIFRWIFGSFFERADNTSGLLAVILIGSSIYIYIKEGKAPDWIIAAVFAVIGFYFGRAKLQAAQDEDDNSN